MMIQLFSALAVQRPLQAELLPRFSAETGIEVAAVFEPTAVLEEMIAAGSRPDCIIGITAAVDALAAAGTVDPASVTRLVRSGIGVAVAAGAPHPDIHDLPALVAALRASEAVAYSQAGASGRYFDGLLERLGIADEVRARAVIPAKGFVAETLVDGRAALAIQQLSELATVAGIEIVGPLPEGAQQEIEISGGVCDGPGNSRPARRLLDFLGSDAAADVFSAARLSPAAKPSA